METTTINNGLSTSLLKLLSAGHPKDYMHFLDQVFGGFIGSEYCSEMGINQRSGVYLTHLRIKEFFEEFTEKQNLITTIRPEIEASFQKLISFVGIDEILSDLDDMFSGFIGSNFCAEMHGQDRQKLFFFHTHLNEFFTTIKNMNAKSTANDQ